ncbi:alpha/beta fold hydrolase [Nocardioides sp.]|uniref:alpha/beta fold hydrolase n=1 Tax=Nocardioides sp. TaxID=35761 RepID=UPI003D0F572E
MTDISTLPRHTELVVEVSTGDTLFVRDFGPPDAPAVIYHHGTPSSSLEIPGGWGGVPPGVRLVTFDRPGYGDSPNRPGRLVGDAGAWSAAIADALGIDRFAVMGTSGGGPHVAAAAATLGDRITRSCVSVGLGPAGLPGFDWEPGMPAETVDEMRRARTGESSLRPFIEELMGRDDPLAEWMEQLPPSDQEILGRPEVVPEEEANTERALGGGWEGWLEDDLAFFHRAWGVDLADTTAETLLLYGAADVLVPAAHGDAMRTAIGHGVVVKVPGAGHWMRDVEPAVLRWLTAGDDRPFVLDERSTGPGRR